MVQSNPLRFHESLPPPAGETSSASEKPSGGSCVNPRGSEPELSLIAGTLLGRYEIQSPLGAGGIGEVYRARDTVLDRTVAVKIAFHHT